MPAIDTMLLLGPRACSASLAALRKALVHPVVRGAAAVGVLSIASFLWGVAPAPSKPTSAPTGSARVPVVLTSLPCGPREFPEGDVCVRLPTAKATSGDAAPSLVDAPMIPRMPDRPSDVTTLQLPLEGDPRLVHGWDPPVVDARGAPLELSAEFAAQRGEIVRAVRLDGQVGDTTVAALGRHVGNTVITKHLVGDPARTFLLVHGRLDAIPNELAVGGRVGDGEIIGFAGDSGDPGVVRLLLQARLVREGITTEERDLRSLVDGSSSTPTDLRNVLAPQP